MLFECTKVQREINELLIKHRKHPFDSVVMRSNVVILETLKYIMCQISEMKGDK